MEEIVGDQDTCIDVVADGVYEGQQTSRNTAVINCQAWRLAFSAEGQQYAAGKGWSGNLLNLVDWLADNYTFKFPRDPVPSWQKQAAKLGSQKSPHAALVHYSPL
ncbi:MAG: hypothetical protein JWM58_1032 [Rhizobium sp.]|nr:hypothetical protein [Rhizobium sp.]